MKIGLLHFKKREDSTRIHDQMNNQIVKLTRTWMTNSLNFTNFNFSGKSRLHDVGDLHLTCIRKFFQRIFSQRFWLVIPCVTVSHPFLPAGELFFLGCTFLFEAFRPAPNCDVFWEDMSSRPRFTRFVVVVLRFFPASISRTTLGAVWTAVFTLGFGALFQVWCRLTEKTFENGP